MFTLWNVQNFRNKRRQTLITTVHTHNTEGNNKANYLQQQIILKWRWSTPNSLNSQLLKHNTHSRYTLSCVRHHSANLRTTGSYVNELSWPRPHPSKSALKVALRALLAMVACGMVASSDSLAPKHLLSNPGWIPQHTQILLGTHRSAHQQ